MSLQPTQTAPPPVELAEVFREAARLIEDGGLCKGWYHDDGSHCAVGAIRFAAGPTTGSRNDLLARAAEQYLSSRVDSATVAEDPVERIADWNDRPERTAGEVVAALTAAAEDVERDALAEGGAGRG